MNWGDHFVRFTRQETEQLVGAWPRRFVRAADTNPRRPDTGEEGEWLLLVDCEPALYLPRLRVFPFAERCPGDKAAVLNTSPWLPVPGFDIADIGDACVRVSLGHETW